MKKHALWKKVLIDVLCAGLALIVFALFHHVLPRQQQGLGIVIADSSRTASSGSAAASADSAPFSASSVPSPDSAASSSLPSSSLPDSVGTVAAAGKSDTPYAKIGGRSSNGSGSSGRNSNSPGGKSPGGKGGRSGGSNGSNGMNGKGGSALTDSGSDTAASSDDTPLAEKFADKYTDTVVVTENSYSSPDLSITVTEETSGNATYYLADIYVRDISCFRSALAGDTYGSGFRDSIEDMALLNNALLAVNGDYYGNTREGVVIRNGVIYRANTTSCDVCVLYQDGTMRVMPGASFSVEEAVEQGAWQAWTFGPALLDTDGSMLTSFASTGRMISANPRTAIGYYEPGHYCLVVVDGRGESAGMTLQELSRLFHDLGCTVAYNLDGGNSSVMVWGDEVINNPSGGGRESSDALLIAEVKSYD